MRIRVLTFQKEDDQYIVGQPIPIALLVAGEGALDKFHQF